MEDYRSNANRFKQIEQKQEETPKKEVHKVVHGKVKKKKRNVILDEFIREDIEDVKEHVFKKVIVPSVCDLIINAVNNILLMLLKGETRGRDYNPNRMVDYRRYSDTRDIRDIGRVSYERRERSSYSNIVLEDEKDAIDVLAGMKDLLERYNAVSVLDLYDLLGFYELLDIPTEPNDNKFGWKDLSNARIVSVADGYLLKLPRPIPFD